MDFETYVLTPGKMSGALLIVDLDILQGRISNYHSLWNYSLQCCIRQQRNILAFGENI